MKMPAFVAEYPQSNSIVPAAYATTECDPNTGTMSTDYTNGAGYGPQECLKQHENQHRVVGEPCCKRYQRCYNNPAVPNATCDLTFQNWFNRTENRDECRAYNSEINCLLAALKKQLSVEDRTTLTTRLREAQEYKDQYCPNPSRPDPCPFLFDGTPR